jgi:hypothetical protein
VEGRTAESHGERRWLLLLHVQSAARPTNAIVQGNFSTAGGTGNEIEAFILSKDDFERWWNGEHRPTIYQSGKVVQGTIKATLPAGAYYLVLSNQVSQASPKVVRIDVTLTYNL